MKPLIILALALSAQFSLAGEYFENFKQLYTQSIAPTSVGDAMNRILDITQCLSYNQSEQVSELKLGAEIITIKEARGPAFPAVTIDAIVLGDTHKEKPKNFAYRTLMIADGLEIDTIKTISSESCDDFEGMGTICSWTVDSQELVKLKIRVNGNYVVFRDETAKSYGYCW